MKTQLRTITGSIIIGSIFALSACSSDNPSPSLSPTPIASAAPTASPAATIAPSLAPSATPLPATPAPTADAGIGKTEKQLKDLMALAQKGMIPGVKYVAHKALIDDILSDWGNPDKKDPSGKGYTYSTYDKKHVVVGSNKGSVVFDLRSNDASLQELTLKQIEQALGKPQDTKVNGEDKIYIYKANELYQLKFIIPNSTGKVDHISVFSPKDAVNNMAE